MSIIEELKVVFRDAMLDFESVKHVENDKWRVDCLFWVFPGLYSIYVINKDTGKMASIDNLREYDSRRVYDEMCNIHGLA